MDPVDLALVLAFDGSASVTGDEFGLIASGCAAALTDPDVVAGLTGGPRGGSACAVVVWSGPGAREVMLDWTRIDTEATAAAFAARVADVPRTVPAGTTAIGEALLLCEALLTGLPAPAGRRVIDIAGDGQWNAGVDPAPVRDRLAAAGVTINGLCVLHEEPDLLESYRREVIGGPGAFAVWCAGYDGFSAALRQKVRREIARGASPRDLTRS